MLWHLFQNCYSRAVSQHFLPVPSRAMVSCSEDDAGYMSMVAPTAMVFVPSIGREVMWRWRIPVGKTAKHGQTFFSPVFSNRLWKNRKWIGKG